jgi:hypothetical protein
MSLKILVCESVRSGLCVQLVELRFHTCEFLSEGVFAAKEVTLVSTTTHHSLTKTIWLLRCKPPGVLFPVAKNVQSGLKMVQILCPRDQ